MKKNEKISICQVANGFHVVSFFQESREDSQVFQSFAELVNWLSVHFEHRNILIIGDDK